MSQVVADARKLEGVAEVDPDRVAGRIRVVYDSKRTSETAVLAAVEALIELHGQ